jgi:hypothetical protein
VFDLGAGGELSSIDAHASDVEGFSRDGRALLGFALWSENANALHGAVLRARMGVSQNPVRTSRFVAF